MYELVLPFVPPFHWDAMVSFLRVRAVGGIEVVDDRRYRSAVRLGRWFGTIEVRPVSDTSALVASVDLPARTGREVERRLRSMFDLDCDPARVARILGMSPILGGLLQVPNGIRVPGAWDPFEILVRAIVGQQVSVAGARTILGRLVERACDGQPTSFPSAEQLAATDLRGLGMPDGRAENLRRVCRAVATGELELRDDTRGRRALLAQRGVGPWTVEYVAMRAFRDPDAFPEGDLVLRRVAGGGTPLAPRALREMAECWRPYRAYAAMLLWREG